MLILYIAALRRGKRERRAVCREEAAVTGKENRLMKTKKRKRGLSFLLAVLATAACLLTGCGAQKSEAQEDAETIQVYLWNTTLYEKYAPYI